MSIARPVRLSEAAAKYLAEKRARRAARNTLQSDHRILQALIRSIGDLQIRNVTETHVADYFYGARGVSVAYPGHTAVEASTHNQYRSRIGVFFEWCRLEGLIRRDVMKKVERAKIRTKRRQQPAPDLLLQLLDQAQTPRDRCYLAMAMNTALRQSEIISITFGAVDLRGGVMDVDIWKTGEQDALPITSELDAELRTWLVIYAEHLERPLKREDYLFPTRHHPVITRWEAGEDGVKRPVWTPIKYNPAKPMDRSHEVVKRAMRNLGLDTYYEGTHTIRRAVARAYFDSITADKGYDGALRATSALLHHQKQATTEGYLGLKPEIERRNSSMRGKPFLSAMVDNANVVPLRAV